MLLTATAEPSPVMVTLVNLASTPSENTRRNSCGALTVLSAAGVSLFKWAWANTEVAVAKDASNATERQDFFAKLTGIFITSG